MEGGRRIKEDKYKIGNEYFHILFLFLWIHQRPALNSDQMWSSLWKQWESDNHHSVRTMPLKLHSIFEITREQEIKWGCCFSKCVLQWEGQACLFPLSVLCYENANENVHAHSKKGPLFLSKQPRFFLPWILKDVGHLTFLWDSGPSSQNCITQFFTELSFCDSSVLPHPKGPLMDSDLMTGEPLKNTEVTGMKPFRDNFCFVAIRIY